MANNNDINGRIPPWVLIVGAVLLSLWVLFATWSVFGVEPQLAKFPPERGRYKCVVLKITDADTVRLGLVVDLGRCRFVATKSDEPNTEKGKRATEYLKTLVAPGDVLTVDLYGKDKYQRPLVDIESKQGQWVCKEMIESGHAKPYREEP